MLDWRGRALRDHVIGRMVEISDDVVVLVGRDDASQRDDRSAHVHFVNDAGEFPGPLVALNDALKIARHDTVIVVAADMPLVPVRTLELLGERLEHSGASVVGLELDGSIEQLPLALLRTAVVAQVAAMVASGQRRLGAVARLPGALAIPEHEWRAIDPNGDSLRDIDTEEDLAALLREPIDD
jgi:molybdopterin-guanine dinucleotide biosynthesis protein A